MFSPVFQQISPVDQAYGQAPPPTAQPVQQGQTQSAPAGQAPAVPQAAPAPAGAPSAARAQRGYNNTPTKQTSGQPGSVGRPPAGTKKVASKRANALCMPPMPAITGPMSGMGPAGVGMKAPEMTATPMQGMGGSPLPPAPDMSPKMAAGKCCKAKMKSITNKRIKTKRAGSQDVSAYAFPGAVMGLGGRQMSQEGIRTANTPNAAGAILGALAAKCANAQPFDLNKLMNDQMNNYRMPGEADPFPRNPVHPGPTPTDALGRPDFPTRRIPVHPVEQPMPNPPAPKQDEPAGFGDIPGVMTSGAGLGATLGALAGSAYGVGRGNVPEGLGRGMITGGLTGAGAGLGGVLGQMAGQHMSGGQTGTGSTLGALAGMGLGGAAGYMGSGMLMGPDSRKRKDQTDMEKAEF